jgi:hypothetical protein
MSQFDYRLVIFTFVCSLMAVFATVEAAGFKIYGSVSDADGQVIGNAQVSLSGTAHKTVSDETGQYLLKFESEKLPSSHVIVFVSQGYKTEKKKFTLKETSSRVIPLNLKMKKNQPQQSAPSGQAFFPDDTSPAQVAPKTPPAQAQRRVAQSPKPKIRTKRELRYVMGQPTWVEVPLTREEIAAEDARLRAISEAQNPKEKKPQLVTGPPVKFEIKGNVVNERGRGVRNAEVFLGKNGEAYTTTDRRGKFTLTFLIPQARVVMARTLIIQHPDFAKRHVNVKFNPETDAGVTLSNITLRSYRGMLDRR